MEAVWRANLHGQDYWPNGSVGQLPIPVVLQTLRNVDETEPDGLDDSDGAAGCLELAHGVLDVKIDSILADGENHADIPGGFALGGPGEAIAFALGQSTGRVKVDRVRWLTATWNCVASAFR